MKISRGWYLALLVLGIAFRLAYPQAIEFKADEAQMLGLLRQFQQTHHLSFIGLGSSGGLMHPGFGNWIFILLGSLFHVNSPVGLARITQVFGSIAILILAWFGERYLEPSYRKAWRLGVLIEALNPFQVITGRKIWTSSLFSPFFALLLCFWASRKTSRVAAFFWGLTGALMAQVHLAGVYPVFALWVWSLRQDLKERKISWVAWVSGSCVGAIPLIPWILAIERMSRQSQPHFKWFRPLMLKYWNFWVTTCQSWVVHANIGGDLFQLFPRPRVLGFPTYLFGMFTIFSFALTGLGVIFLLSGFWEFVQSKDKTSIFWGSRGDPELLIAAMLIGQGLIMSFSFININNYYLMALFPVPAFWFALKCERLQFRWKKWIPALWTAGQILTTVIVLNWVHMQPHVGGDFGTPYWAQKHG